VVKANTEEEGSPNYLGALAEPKLAITHGHHFRSIEKKDRMLDWNGTEQRRHSGCLEGALTDS
jgi:hypothetical protein